MNCHPRHVVSEDAQEVLRLYYVWRGGMANGALPFSGGYLEQPACILASFEFIASLMPLLKTKGAT